MRSYGIMQGRLTPSKDRGIQFFPFENWTQEFYASKSIKLNQIEFIFDYDNYEQNPLWTSDGARIISKVMKDTDVIVHSICCDYFMRRPFYKFPPESRSAVVTENKNVMRRLLLVMRQLDMKLLEIPLVDHSSIKTEEEKDLFLKFISEIALMAEQISDQISIGLETDLPPRTFLSFLNQIGKKRIGANYDSGNSSGIGYDPYEEVTTLRDKIFNIHIKDRVYHGSTVPLGTGSADFPRLFQGLHEINYQGAFILQAARGEDGKEIDNIASQMAFLKNLVSNYGLS